MDRDRIERKDFSAARRGYDQDEVDRHLRTVADEVERLERERSSGAGLSGAAAEQIRAIIEAAERSAAEITERAQSEAATSGRDTDAYARDVRERADADAAEHVERVQQATRRLLEQTDAAEAELDRLLTSLREDTGSFVDAMRKNVESVQAELDQIREALPALHGTPGPGSSVSAAAAMAAGAGRPEAADTREAVTAPSGPEVDVAGEEEEELPAGEAPDEFEVEATEPTAEREPRVEDAPPTGEVAAAAEPAAEELEAEEESGAREAPRAIAGSEGARLIALNMALNGTPREETARYLSENFEIEDQDAVLDDVYSRVGA